MTKLSKLLFIYNWRRGEVEKARARLKKLTFEARHFLAYQNQTAEYKKEYSEYDVPLTRMRICEIRSAQAVDNRKAKKELREAQRDFQRAEKELYKHLKEHGYEESSR